MENTDDNEYMFVSRERNRIRNLKKKMGRLEKEYDVIQVLDFIREEDDEDEGKLSGTASNKKWDSSNNVNLNLLSKT